MKLYVFLYGKTIDVIPRAEHKNYMRIKKRTVNKNTFGVIILSLRRNVNIE